jgi:hypothetical protein
VRSIIQSDPGFVTLRRGLKPEGKVRDDDCQ